MRAFLTLLTLGAAVVALGVRPVHADPDELSACKVGLLKAGKLSKIVCKQAFTLPSTPPTTTGGAVTFREVGGGSGATYPLPVAGWTGLGNPPGVAGFKFHGTNCPAVLVKTNIVKAVCKDPNTLPLPLGTDLFVTLALPETTPTKRYCAQFGGTMVKSTSTIFKAKDAAPPATCDPPPPSTTTTTSSTLPPACNCCGFSQLSLTSAAGSGSCGTVKDDFDVTQLDLSCGRIYKGGGSGYASGITIPDLSESRFNIASCAPYTGAVTLSARTLAQTGSLGTCTEAGCIFGAPIPYHTGIVIPGNPEIVACAINFVDVDATGSFNCLTGEAHLNVPVGSYITLSYDTHPCPICDPGTNTCQGGANDGNPCTPGSSTLGGDGPTSADCLPSYGGSAGNLALDLTTQSAVWTATNGLGSSSQVHVFSGFCRDVTNGPDPGSYTFDPAKTLCLENGTTVAACSEPYESCEQRTEGAFSVDGARTITENGAPFSACLDDGLAHTATMAGVFSVPSADDPYTPIGIDTFTDLPGPGAVSVPYTVKLLP